MKAPLRPAMVFGGLLFALSLAAATAAEKGRDKFAVVGADRLDVFVLNGDTPLFLLHNNLCGPEWKQGRLERLAEVKDGKTRAYEQEKVGFYNAWTDTKPIEGRFDLRYELSRVGENAIRMKYVCRTEYDTAFGVPKGKGEKSIAIGPVLGPSPYFSGGTCTLTFANGKSEETPLPPPRAQKPAVASVALRTAAGETTRLIFDPPAVLHCDNNELRCFALQQVKAGATMTQTITLELPHATTFEPANRLVDISGWYPLDAEQANDCSQPSLIGMESWQEKPAGQHGFLQTQGDRFVFEDGTPVKFWGVNPLKVDQTVSEQYLAQSARALERLGVNLVRFHAFGKPNVPKKWAHMLKIQSVDDGLKFDAAHLPLFDYGFAKMKEHGTYSGWSVIYGWYATPADKKRLINYDEAENLFAGGHWVGSFYEMTAFMPDVQDLIIQFHVNLLEHVNPHTGKRYADDPALAYIELQNEENAFLALRKYEAALKKAPTYQDLLYKRFAAWLKAKYATREALAAAWGQTLKTDETLNAANITPFPSYYQGKPSQRIADQMAFIYSTQKEYYGKFAAAVRKTGYKGQIIGSCWQSADWVGHLYNVLSDRDIGFIDRHNYNKANLKIPGGGLLSAGFQAVLDRPFTFSEWAGGARVGETLDVPLVAVYGMGLQGWDASMQFAWDHPGTLPYKSRGVNNTCNDFGALAQYPALARMVRRGDVRQGDVVGNRRVSLPALLATGDVGFSEQFSLLGGANNKSFNAAVPSAALAAGRVVLEFVDGPVEKPVIDKSAAYIDATKCVARSTTGQLLWDYSAGGFFTVDTPGTKAVIGHAGGKAFSLGEVSIAPANPFAIIYVTAPGKTDTVATAKSLLITTTARMVDNGTVFDDLSEKALANAPHQTGPVLIEPVSATIELKRQGPCRVFALDHGGRKTSSAVEIPVEKTTDGYRFTVASARTKSPYYVVEFTP